MSTQSITFDLLTESSSIERARDTDHFIEQLQHRGPYLVAFEDSDTVHEVELRRDAEGSWSGDCWTLDESGQRVGHCQGWAFHDTPCAHLWAVRSHKAAQFFEEADPHSNDVERVMADGGHHHHEEGPRP